MNAVMENKWFQPLPLESAIGAIVGALLSVAFASTKVVTISNLTSALAPAFYLFFMLVYAAQMHLCCKSIQLGSNGIFWKSFSGLIINIIAINIIWADKFSFSDEDGFNWKPNNYVTFATSCLIVWFLVSVLFSYLSNHLKEG